MSILGKLKVAYIPLLCVPASFHETSNFETIWLYRCSWRNLKSPILYYLWDAMVEFSLVISHKLKQKLILWDFDFPFSIFFFFFSFPPHLGQSLLSFSLALLLLSITWISTALSSNACHTECNKSRFQFVPSQMVTQMFYTQLISVLLSLKIGNVFLATNDEEILS